MKSEEERHVAWPRFAIVLNPWETRIDEIVASRTMVPAQPDHPGGLWVAMSELEDEPCE